MGRFPGQLGKALTPTNYGDDPGNPRRTMLLLHAWGINRARMLGWFAETDARKRQGATDIFNLDRDIRAFGAPLVAPLLANGPAHALLLKWVPDIVLGVVG